MTKVSNTVHPRLRTTQVLDFKPCSASKHSLNTVA